VANGEFSERYVRTARAQGVERCSVTAALKLASVTGDAERFLALLAPGERVTFQTFDESGMRRGQLSRVLHGTLAEHAGTLTQLNARGAGVYWMVSAGDGNGRKASNVQRVRALFVDLDGAPLQPVRAAPLQPHCVVETSPGRWHAYWRVADCPLADFRLLQKALIEQFNADTKPIDLPRVMRLPGFDHRKREPYRSHLIAVCDSPQYTLAQFRAAFGFASVANVVKSSEPPSRRTLPGKIDEGERNSTLFSLACGLVNKGHGAAAVNHRLQRINAERCMPPLCASEVDAIAANASAYGSAGFAKLPHRLMDSPEWRALPPASHDMIVLAFRRYNGSNNGNIALTPEDFKGRKGFGNRQTFYRHRRLVQDTGILQLASEGRQTQNGKKPDLFAIAPQWLHDPQVSILKPCASIENGHSYIDKHSSSNLMIRGTKRAKKRADGDQ
jgi:hypothetical protein